ncbi:MAG: stress-induced protein [Pseudomonas orientalis]|nr:stress-induced protein [Pseudomonas orientalis]
MYNRHNDEVTEHEYSRQTRPNEGGQNSGGNFKNDPERASEAGRKGGQNSGGNFANDREKASEAGRKGGEHSHGGGRNS